MAQGAAVWEAAVIMTEPTSFAQKAKDILFIALVFILPTIPVGYRYGVRSTDFWISLVLLIVFPIFSVVHGIYVLMLHPRPAAHEGYVPIDEESQAGSCCNANEQPQCPDCGDCCATQTTPLVKPMVQRPKASEQAVEEPVQEHVQGPVQGTSDSPPYNPPAYTETNHSATFDNKVQSAN